MKTNKQLYIKIFFFLVLCNISFGQNTILRSTSGFALFTSEGGIFNIGKSFIAGDIGTANGLVNNFSSGIILGQVYVENATSLQTVKDIVLANKSFDSLKCGIVIKPTLGNNQNLTANVYCINSDASLHGDLILDGRNDTSAVFIFKIEGGFSSSSFSNIKMINGASLWNVYWQIDGKVILGDQSVFRGTFLATGAISLLEGATLLGRGITSKGNITLNNNIII